MTWLGEYPEDFTTVTCMFTTHGATGAPIAPLSAFEAADIRIYKNGNAAEKTTANGVVMTSPFDTITGLHCVTIDTSVDTGDSGFWTTGGGSVYTIVLNPDETVDGIAVLKVVGQFMIKTAVSVSVDGNAVADALYDRDMAAGVDTSSATKRTLRQAIRYLRNKVSVTAGVMTVCKEDDVTASWTATVTESATANPIISIDPAGP